MKSEEKKRNEKKQKIEIRREERIKCQERGVRN